MSQPYEIVMAPMTAWVSLVGTAFPTVDAAPAAGWFKLGTSGNLNYDAAGVTVTQNQTLVPYTPAGGTVPRKVVRSDEGFEVGFTLDDLTPEQYAKVFDDAAIIVTAQSSGVAGNKAFELRRGTQVKTFALLARGLSSVDDSLNAQFEVAACYQAGNPAPVFSKGAAAGLAIMYTAIEKTPGVVATLRTQTTVAG